MFLKVLMSLMLLLNIASLYYWFRIRIFYRGVAVDKTLGSSSTTAVLTAILTMLYVFRG